MAYRYWTRPLAAERITEEYFPVKPRSLLDWGDVPIVYLNGKACAPPKHWRAAAAKRLAEQLTRQGAELPPLQAAARATTARMERRRAASSDLPPAA
jgi:hypothetical protein